MCDIKSTSLRNCFWTFCLILTLSKLKSRFLQKNPNSIYTTLATAAEGLCNPTHVVCWMWRGWWWGDLHGSCPIFFSWGEGGITATYKWSPRIFGICRWLLGLVSASVFIVDKSTKFKSQRRQLSTKQDMQNPRFLGTITIFGSIANFRDFVKSTIFQC